MPPLISCVMPTFERPAFAAQAIDCFLSQDHRNAELVIVDDGASIRSLIPTPRERNRVSYIQTPQRMTIGAKRDLGCALARGSFIAHWDDDEWYPVDRLSFQLAAMADDIVMCGTGSFISYDCKRDEAIAVSAPSMPGYPRWMLGSTLFYRTEVWRAVRFADEMVEDNRFIVTAARIFGANRLLDLDRPSLCVHNMHGGNAAHLQFCRPWLASAATMGIDIAGAIAAARSQRMHRVAPQPSRPALRRAFR